MRERYETLKITDLREIVKNMKIKGYSTMSKDELIDILVEKEKEMNANGEQAVQGVVNEPEPVEVEGEGTTEKAVDKKTMAVVGTPGFEQEYDPKLDSHNTVTGITEIMPDGFGFIRSDNFLSGDHDVYISPGQIRKFGLRTGDIVTGNTKIKGEKEKFSALLYITKINGFSPEMISKRLKFEEMTPVFPDEKIKLDIPGCPVSMRIVDLVSPIGKGQRGMIVSQPKAGKTTLLKDIARSVLYNNKGIHMIILLIDERPEEVTDIKEAIRGDNVEVI